MAMRVFVGEPVQGALEAAQAQRRWQVQWFPLQAAGAVTQWVASPGALCALHALATALIA